MFTISLKRAKIDPMAIDYPIYQQITYNGAIHKGELITLKSFGKHIDGIYKVEGVK
jgi:hypothetical protein